jgi:hypothetical protein
LFFLQKCVFSKQLFDLYKIFFNIDPTIETKPLKRAFSIALLIVFLFNVGGYYIIFWGLRFQVNQQLNARLDAHQYTVDETIELKIPVSLPYSLEQKDYERVSGKFEYKGEFYNLIKQKHHQDTLHIICIKDNQEKRLVDSMNNYVKLSNDLPGAASKAMNFLGKLLKDFEHGTLIILEQHHGWSASLIFHHTTISFENISGENQSPPPRV